MSAAHTPGPWVVDETDVRDEAQAILCDRNGLVVADAHLGARGGECEANARLIAAAPDYAEVAPTAADLLEQYADFIRRDVKADDLERPPYLPLIDQTVADLRAVIAKATGQ